MFDFWAVARDFGLPIAMLMAGVVALYYDWVVSGRRYRAVVKQRDDLFKLVLSGQKKAWRTTELVKAVVEPAGGEGEGEPRD